MTAFTIAGSDLLECSRCDGIWTDAGTLRQICTDHEKQAAVLNMPGPPLEPGGLEKEIRYLPCPVCHQLMNRVNFARCSHVIVDVCKAHGTWFDKDELRRLVQFIRAGGLEKARGLQIADMEEARRRLDAARNANMQSDLEHSCEARGQSGLVADFLKALFG